MEPTTQKPFLGFFDGDVHGQLADFRERWPVAPLRLPDGRTGWLLTRHDDVRRALADPRLVKDGLLSPLGFRPQLPPEVYAATAQNMLTVEPPDHTRLRRMIQGAFTPRRIGELAPAITATTDRLIDALDTPGTHDLVTEFAFPLPVAVISDLLGVPLDERGDFTEWASILASGVHRKSELPGAVVAMITFIRHLVAGKRERPGDDLTSALTTATDQGDQLTEDELVSTIYLLILAGYDTTANLIGNGAWLLLRDRTWWSEARADPDRLPKIIEEMLRYESPVQLGTHRMAAEDVSYGGQLIPAGSTVLLSLLSANHDDRVMAEPEVFEPARTRSVHLAFGHGIHHCLGAPLARLEARIAFTRLVSCLPETRLADGFVPRWRASALLRGLEDLVVTTR
ncbi:cytochrome P450 hydroxylase [Asanoa ishikariensis]|uniref:Cytochrome P450 n=1 Tax=Asanoa ishikariensis TaxID=137265 RepID=A0A1H3U9S1_9ACTN|nr:cytochrome P450 [Asanoa ishikariensis]GIF64110.1 cytochrome P450 hydroxylase [Asanoa ishikariensis]SDZ58565.1 Cytochrome P450 [Asanoa ishikariensis]